MLDVRVVVIHQFPHARGTLVAGLEGRTYRVSADNGALHLVSGDECDPVPGCYPADADRYLLFRAFRRAVPPPPPPPPPAIPGDNAVVDRQPPESGSPPPQAQVPADIVSPGTGVEAAVPPTAKRRRRNP